MISLQSLIINTLWIVGLAGVLAVFSYVSWIRRLRNWSWGYAFSLPRYLVPLCVSFELFSIGVAMSGVIAYQPAPWWETAAWTILAVLFAILVIVYGTMGWRHGWDTPLEGREND